MMRFFKIFTETAAASASVGHRVKKTAAALLSSGLAIMAVCAMVVLSSCSWTHEGEPVPVPVPEEQGYLDVSVVVPPVSETEETRHGTPVPGSTAENQIANLSFFVFNASNTFELYKAITINTADNTSTDPMWDPATSSLRLLLTVGQKTIYVIANWFPLSDISGYNTIAGLESLTKYNSDGPTIVVPLTMTAKITPTLTGGDAGISVELTRQKARVRVFPMLSANAKAVNAQVTFEGILFRNIPLRSYVFPRSVSPSTSTWSQVNFTGTSSAVITATQQAAATEYGSPLYTPEFFGNAAEHTSMVIKAKYNGTDTYYTIPINAETGAYPALYAVERNHSYKYFVTVQGIGSETAVFSALPSLHEPGVANITYELEIEE